MPPTLARLLVAILTRSPLAAGLLVEVLTITVTSRLGSDSLLTEAASFLAGFGAAVVTMRLWGAIRIRDLTPQEWCCGLALRVILTPTRPLVRRSFKPPF
ncbi:hypothetical protein ACFQ6U_35935 [Streptomyces sp. NPDC056465]|uniref:hypothetical protein n=1 Tax=Streptomyces sp. NPDC056465 TaxID=3345829 RepID=UPI003696557A